MLRNRKLLILAILLVALAIFGLFLALHSFTAPEIARMLPEGDLVLYANLKPVHLFLSSSAPRTEDLEPDYRDFISRTGIHFERDLDELAMSRRSTSDGRDTESSEVAAGSFDSDRLKAWLEKTSAQRDSYRNRIIYLIPHEGHSVRVCLLDDKRVAVTNMTSSDPMHAIVDAADSRPPGPSLVQSYYKQVPALSVAWMLVHVGSGPQAGQTLGGFNFDFLENTTAVASLRYKGDLLVRADIFAASEDRARNVADSAVTFLAISRTAAQSMGTHGTDPDVKAAIDSIRVQQNKNVATLTATLSDKFLKKFASEAQSAAGQPEAITPASSPSPAPAPQRRRRHRGRAPTVTPTPPAE